MRTDIIKELLEKPTTGLLSIFTVIKKKHITFTNYYYYCPECADDAISRAFHFCPVCGVKILWEDLKK